jgi:hypothetical protein
MAEAEQSASKDAADELGNGSSPLRRSWRRGLNRFRDRFWNWHPDPRRECFIKALDDVERFEPDWVIANGDYGGDARGVGISDEDTFESASVVISMVRDIFHQRCRFIFGDHDLGKYSTNLRGGGIRIESLIRGEQLLGIKTFWDEVVDEFHLIGINSSLFGLDHFLPEALKEEVPEWTRRRSEHESEVQQAFAALDPKARVLLFCHDPGALVFLERLPEVQQRKHQIERTVLGHLHAPGLLALTRLLPKLPRLNPKYPVARIVAHSLRDARTWHQFRPVLCPSTFGAGKHMKGGALFAETSPQGELIIRRHRVAV